MATYECKECGMSVNATCGKCDTPLVNDHIHIDGGTTVQVSKCPNDPVSYTHLTLPTIYSV